MALEFVDLIVQAGYPGENWQYQVPSIEAKYPWICGFNGDLDLGRVLVDLEIKNDGDVDVYVSTKGVLAAMSGSNGSNRRPLAAGDKIFLAGPIESLVIYNDDATDPATDIVIEATKTANRNSGYEGGHPGTGELVFRIPNVPDDQSEVIIVARFPFDIAENAARVYAVAKRTSSGGGYLLDIEVDKTPSGGDLESLTANYDLEGLTNKALATPNNDGLSVAKDCIVKVRATSDDADLTAGGDLLVIIPITL